MDALKSIMEHKDNNCEWSNWLFTSEKFVLNIINQLKNSVYSFILVEWHDFIYQNISPVLK